MPGTELAIGVSSAAIATIVLSKIRGFCKTSGKGCTGGCGFTDHSLFDQNEVQLEKTTLNGVEVLYSKQPWKTVEPDSPTDEEDEDEEDE